MNCSDVEGGGSVQGKDKGKSKSKKRSSSGGGEKKRDTTAATLANINRRRQKVEETVCWTSFISLHLPADPLEFTQHF